MKTKRPNYPLFKEYTEEIRNFLRETCYFEGVPEEKNISVFHTTPPRAFVNVIAPLINRKQFRPIVSFNLASSEILRNELGLGFVKKYEINKDEGYIRQNRHPIPFKLNYQVVFWTETKTQADIIATQLYLAGNQNRKWVAKVRGHFIEVEVSSIENQTNLEPGPVQDVAFRYGGTISISKAILPYDYLEYGGFIEKASLEFGVNDETDTELMEQGYDV